MLLLRAMEGDSLFSLLVIALWLLLLLLLHNSTVS
jgi:hypothetical protein